MAAAPSFSSLSQCTTSGAGPAHASSASAHHDDPRTRPSSLEPLSCVVCRVRKLKCDRAKPACGRCVKLLVGCVYPEARRKPKARRRNVRELEARLAHVEEMLQEAGKAISPTKPGPSGDASRAGAGLGDGSRSRQLPDSHSDIDIDASLDQDVDLEDLAIEMEDFDVELDNSPSYAEPADHFFAFSTHQQTGHVPGNAPFDFSPFPQQPADPEPNRDPDYGSLVGLGMAETLPPLEIIEELHDEFFKWHYHYAPIVHPGRYLNAFYSPPHMRPPMCLQYIIWALAATRHEKYDMYHDAFYRRARAYVEMDEMKGMGEHFVTIPHAQALCLLASYEARASLFTRSSMDLARAVRLVAMMGLHRLDGDPGPMMPAMLPPQSWVELEERRRTFWGIFCIDSHASISSGWPSLIDSSEIFTRLPASEEAFLSGQEEKSPTMQEALDGAPYSWFTGTIIICHIHSQLMKHIHRPTTDDRPLDVENGAFWRRHRALDNQLISLFLFLPENLLKPNSPAHGPYHMTINLHSAVIILHQAAIAKIDEFKLPDSLREESRKRLGASAEAIARAAKRTSHMAGSMNVKGKALLKSLVLYLGATAYISVALGSPNVGLSDVDRGNLVIIIKAMMATSDGQHETAMFLSQVLTDIEDSGLEGVLDIPGLAAFKLPSGTKFSCPMPLVTRPSTKKFSQMMSLVQTTFGGARKVQEPIKPLPGFGYMAPMSDFGPLSAKDVFARCSSHAGNSSSGSQACSNAGPKQRPAPVSESAGSGVPAAQTAKPHPASWPRNPAKINLGIADSVLPAIVYADHLPDRTASPRSSSTGNSESASDSRLSTTEAVTEVPRSRIPDVKWADNLGRLDVDPSTSSSSPATERQNLQLHQQQLLQQQLLQQQQQQQQQHQPLSNWDVSPDISGPQNPQATAQTALQLPPDLMGVTNIDEFLSLVWDWAAQSAP